MLEIKVKEDIIQDAVNITNGVYAPLSGFLREGEFKSVLERMRLPGDAVWSIPIVVSIGKSDYEKLKNEVTVKLVSGAASAVLKNIELYKNPKKEYAEKVFGTVSEKHPGVAEIFNGGDFLLGGEVFEVNGVNEAFPDFSLSPVMTKNIFKEKGWRTITAFQTRNVPHLGHEFLQHKALSVTDGLFIQPVIGEKKLEDFKDEYILSSYKTLIEEGIYGNRAILSALPLKMRYAGPREALMHALIRKNYGCTHFIVGRDHAGVGDFYNPTDAQEIFNKFNKKELGIEILKYKEVVYNKRKNVYCFEDECEEADKIRFSGTKLREYVKEKKQPPSYLLREEVYDILVNSYNSLVESMEKNNNQKGFVLWLTGLSAAGKTTIADKVYSILENNGVRFERLDGDVVRENLTKDLGFSKEDRDNNIRRIGFVANLLSRNNVGVIASFISPYRRQRQELRDKVNNFIEVFVDAPLEICEKRDPKGMYKKARAGEIKKFTGIDDPYEKPESPDIHLNSDRMSVDNCAKEIVDYLIKNNFVEKLK